MSILNFIICAPKLIESSLILQISKQRGTYAGIEVENSCRADAPLTAATAASICGRYEVCSRYRNLFVLCTIVLKKNVINAMEKDTNKILLRRIRQFRRKHNKFFIFVRKAVVFRKFKLRALTLKRVKRVGWNNLISTWKLYFSVFANTLTISSKIEYIFYFRQETCNFPKIQTC